MSNWQPIETAPRDGTEVDIWVREYLGWGKVSDKGHRITNVRWMECNKRWDNNLATDIPTHWMPIPEGPSAA